MIGPPATATRDLVGQQRFQTSPFRIGQIVSMQHPPGLPHPALKIRGTRSSAAGAWAKASCRSGGCGDTQCVARSTLLIIATGRFRESSSPILVMRPTNDTTRYRANKLLAHTEVTNERPTKTHRYAERLCFAYYNITLHRPGRLDGTQCNGIADRN